MNTGRHNYSSLALGGMIALFMAGCGVFGGGDGTETASTPPAGTPAPAAPAAPVASPSPKAQPFSGQIVPGQAPAPRTAAGLIPPTNGPQRAKEIDKGRGDPFASVPVRATVTVANPGGNSPGGGTGGSTPGNVPPPLPPLPRPTVGGQTSGGGRSIPVPRPNLPTPVARNNAPMARPSRSPGSPPPVIARIPSPAPLQPKLPSLPAPTLAQGVKVSGVVEIAGVPQAIISTPLETGQSRYVREGQLIADGQVLVKRISVSGGLTPVVVLEQYGQEVVKTIENPSTTPTAQGTAGATSG